MVRIPITGIGVVAPGAVGVSAFRELLQSGRSAIDVVERFDTSGLSAHQAGLVRDFKARDFIHPMKMRRMNGLSRFGVAAAKMAIEDSGASPGPTSGVAMGTAFGPVQTSVEYMQEYVEKGAALAPPQLFAESVANAPGSHIAIEWGLRGFNATFTQRETSVMSAALFAAHQLMKGAAPAALIGGVEEVNELLFSVMDRIGALAREKARPFDKNRDGLSIGEGGAVLVAGSGTRRPYGWLAGFGTARDTTASISDWGTDAETVVKAMRTALEDAGIDLEEVDAIYASANGSRKGDALEQRAIELLFRDRIPTVVAMKGFCGEYCAGGALQLAAALLALDDQRLPASAGFEEGDLPVTREPREAKLRHILVNSLAAGGGVICAILSMEGE